MLVLRDADLVTLKGGVGVTQGKCWLKIWVPYGGIHIVQFFSPQIDIFKGQMAISYFLFGTGTCNEQCKISELCVNFN